MGADRGRRRCSARTLLNRILVDVYGAQRLLKEGLLPPALVLRPRRLPAPVHGAKPPGDTHAAHLRRRPRALARRPLVGARRAHAGALGRGLRAGEPHHHLARLPAGCSATCKVQHLAPASSPRCATACAHWAPADGAAPLIVLLTPGPAQRNLLRARLPRALPRPAAGRGQRPHGARRLRLPEDAVRACKRVHAHPAAPGRRLLRPARAAQRFRARRRRAWSQAMRARQRAGGQRARLEPARVERAARLPARPGASSCSARRCKLPSVATWWCGEPRGARGGRRATSTAW